MSLLLLWILLGDRRGGRHSEDEVWARIAALCLLPVIAAVCSPWLWWRAMRDLGHGQVMSWIAGAVVVLAAFRAGWAWSWAVLLVAGLIGVLAVSHAGRKDARREARLAREEDDAYNDTT